MKMERRSILSEEERKGKKEKVDLSGMTLNTIPNTTINWLLITELDVSNNNLEFIPESLTARLLNAVTLDVQSNQLKNLPNSIGCLTKLKVLNVSGNMLEYLPKSIENCRALEELNANFNKLTRLPDTIGFELTNLRKLSVNSNKLAFLPFSTSHMTSLRVIDVRLNCLHALPDNLENLINLQVLNVSQNFQYLEALPYSVGLLMSLVELDASYNQISALPDSMGCLKNLKKMRVEGNPLVSPPMEVVDQGLDVLKAYLSERMKRNASYPAKRRSWIRKLVKHKTFNGKTTSNNRTRDQDGFLLSDYRSIDGLTSPRYMGMFSPRRLFSPRSYLSR